MSPEKRDSGEAVDSASRKRAAALDAELAALEAELAKLEGRKKASKAAPPKTEQPQAAKRAFSFGKKKEAPDAPVAAPPARVEPPAPTPPAPEPREEPLPRADASLWREENGAWIRTVPREKRVVRRILDEDDGVVREEAAAARDVDEVGAVQAERGVGRLFRRKKDG